jgi:general secretion pathway protein K
LKEEKADSVINCFLDWQDGDNLHRMMGAEKEYYQELNPSYQPANTAIEVIEELLMIKGIDKRLFYGKEALPTVADFVSEDDEETKSGIGEGLSSIFTVYRRIQIGKASKDPNAFIGPFRAILSSKVDLNSAPRAVLMSLPLMDEEIVHAIIDARKKKPIKTEADLVELIGLSSYKGIQKYITLRQRTSRYYTITSTAFSGEEGISHSILAVVDIMPKRRMKNIPFTFIRWEDWKI